MLFMDDILARKRFMLRRKEKLEQRLAEIPKGRLIKKRAKGDTYYYLEQGGKLQSLQQKPELRALYEERKDTEKCTRILSSRGRVTAESCTGSMPV